MKNTLVGILLLGGFFFTFSADAKIIDQDKMVFKISRSVFTLNDLYQIQANMHHLKCIYNESLLNIIFKDQFLLKNKEFLKYRKSFSKQDKAFYISLIEFTKLLIYSRSQNVVVNPNIEKYFHLMAVQNKCNMTVFDKNKSFKPNFKELVELEVFVRSRFLPSEKNDKTTRADIKKAVLASKSLVKSIGRQIEEEVYW